MSRRFIVFFIALAITLTLSGGSLTVYAAKVYTQTYSNPSVSTNQLVTSDFIRNYTRGMSISNYASLITFKNDGGVNVSGGSFYIYKASFENNGAFTFTGSSATFSLHDSSFVNNGTATIKGVYNFGVPDGTSFINNGTLYLEDIANSNLSGFVNNGTIIIPDDAFNSFLHLALEAKNGENGAIYTKSGFENKTLRYGITYDGLSCDGYQAENASNPADYEYAAADPQDVTLAEPSLDGYEFLGWTGLTITEPVKAFTFSSSVCTDITVTAHWKPVVYTITYDLDGGSFYSGQTPNTEYSRGGQPGLIIPYKTGYTFTGWIDTDTNEQVSTGSTIYYLQPGSMGDRHFKARFITNSDTRYQVICYYQNIGGGYSAETHPFTGATGSTVNASDTDYEKTGFTFDAENNGNLLSGTVAADNSLVLKLYFNRNQYAITYKSQDGSETLWTTTKYYGETVGEYGGIIPSKQSDDTLYTYVFDNWAREEPDRDFGYDPRNITISGDMTFYAAFEKVRDESIVVITWEEYDGFNAPAQTELRLDKGTDYIVELELENENYYIGTKEWNLGFKEAHIYWHDAQSGEQAIEYTFDKEDFEAPVTLTIPDIQHDIFIKLKAHYHSEHDYPEQYDTIISDGNCTSDSVIRHFCYKCGKTYDETIPAGGHVTNTTFETDTESHWKTCAICSEKIGTGAHTPDAGVITHTPTHSSTGTKTYTCTVCGYVTGRETLEMIPHTPGEDWQHSAETHYKTCSCGEKLEEAPHTSDSGTVTLLPTYDAEGKMEYRCTVCGYILKTERIPKLEAGASPMPTASPIPTASPVPTVSPIPTVSPVPTTSPVPTVSPVPTISPAPTTSPVPTASPIPTVSPTPTLTGTPIMPDEPDTGDNSSNPATGIALFLPLAAILTALAAVSKYKKK